MTTSGRCGTSRSPSAGARASASSASTARAKAPSSRSSPALLTRRVGTFHIEGRVLSLLELGTGLNPELTGRQNVINSSRLLAFPPGYASERMPQIEAFAELPDGFFDRPVKLYSSGMLVRLVFSMFACFDPDVFVDRRGAERRRHLFPAEVRPPARGDEGRRGDDAVRQPRPRGGRALCDRVLVLHHGRVEHDGDKKTGIRVYYACGGQGLRREEMPVAAPRRDGQRAQRRPAGDSKSPTAPRSRRRPFRRSRSTNSRGTPRSAGCPRRRPGGDHRRRLSADRRRRARAERSGRHAGRLDRGLAARRGAVRNARAVNLGIGLYDRLNRLLFAPRVDQRRAARDRPAGRRRRGGAVRGQARPRAGRVHPLPRRRRGAPRPRRPGRLGPEPRRRPLPRTPARRGHRGAPRPGRPGGSVSGRPTCGAIWRASSFCRRLSRRRAGAGDR